MGNCFSGGGHGHHAVGGTSSVPDNGDLNDAVDHFFKTRGFNNDLVNQIEVRDAGNLLTRAGFTLPEVDVDEYQVRYNSALELIEHLRAMGETKALVNRVKFLKRDTTLATAAVYESMFAAEDGTIPATFQVIYMTGWREHDSQQKAKRRGSATVSFKDIQKEFGGQTS